MFGYVKVYREELLVREDEAYKSVYCGLCRRLGKEYSFLSRFILSYDCTFYAVFLMSAAGSCTGFSKGRCCCNPLKRCSFCTGGEASLSKAAALSVLLAFYKLEDDIADEKFFKRFLCKCVRPFFSHWRKKAAQNYPGLDQAASDMLRRQKEAEADPACCLDKAADPTAHMMARILAEDAADDMQKRIFFQLGYQLGRWIYLIDATDDLCEDEKDGGFNPFLMLPKEERNPQNIQVILSRCLAQMFDAYNLLDIQDFKGILDNIILKGLPVMQEKVLSGMEGVKK